MSDLGMTLGLRSKKCPICGERFNYYPMWHRWEARVNGSMTAVCRYNCMRKVERAEEERRRKYLDAEKKIKDPPDKIKRPCVRQKAITPAVLMAAIEDAQKNGDEQAREIDAYKADGTWKLVPACEKKLMRRKRDYYWARAKALREELGLLSN